ncbi:hypothetical protein STEG23_034473, partial [Scotinomys teguina]
CKPVVSIHPNDSTNNKQHAGNRMMNQRRSPGVPSHLIDPRDFGLEQIYTPDAAEAVKTPSGHSRWSPLISKVNAVQGARTGSDDQTGSAFEDSRCLCE